MEKRIHTKKTTQLTFRHYLCHFKWPVLAITFLLIFLSLLQLHLTTFLRPAVDDNDSSDLAFADVIYPVKFHDEKGYNTSIFYYLRKKDQLKAKDDLQSMNKKQKTILPSALNQPSRDSYLILEFTPVFDKPRFCSAKKAEIFGKKCPYTNWYVNNFATVADNGLQFCFSVNIHAIKHMRKMLTFF